MKISALLRARRPRLSRAEITLLTVSLVALLGLGAAGWLANQRTRDVRGAAASSYQWSLSQPRVRMASALVGHTLWILGGLDAFNAARPDAETFDLTKKPTQRVFGTVAPMALLPRFDHTAQAFGPNIYIFGGLNRPGGVVNATEKLDTRNGFVTLLAPMPTPRRMAHSALYKGKIYVVGGSTTQGIRVGTLEIYDIATDTWTRGTSMKVPREADVALWKGQLVVAGGYNARSEAGGVLSDVEIYDIAANRWRRAPALPQPISAHHSVVSGDWVFLFGDYLTLSRVLAFNARTGVSRELTASGFSPRRHTVAVAHQSRAYVVGGNTSDSRPPLDEVQIFDLKKLQQMAEASS